MSQNIIDFSIDASGEQLLDELLTGMQQNILTSNSGTTRPSYAQNKTVWVDNTTTPWAWKMFNGTDDILLGYIDPTSLNFTPSNIPEILDNYTASSSPSVDDDSDEGYSAGSKWYYSGDIWLCVDATVGSAVWVDTGLQLDDLGSMAFENSTDYYTKTEVDGLVTQPFKMAYAEKTDTASIATSTWTDITGLSVSLTVAEGNSVKISAILNGIGGAAATAGLEFRILRDSTVLNVSDTAGSRRDAAAYGGSANSIGNATIDNIAVDIVDEDPGAGTYTYKVQWSISSSTGYLNRTANDTNDSSYARTISSIRAEEGLI